MDAQLLSGMFVELADTLVADFDTVGFLHLLTDRSVRLLSASCADVVLVGPRGELRSVAASSEAAGLLGQFQIISGQGPCLECVRTARPAGAADLEGPAQRWPRFAAAAADAGFRTAQSLPMRLRDEVVGSLNLLGTGTASFSDQDLRIGQAMADVATIGLLQERSVRRSETAAERLQGTLNSQVVIEQAKGKLAERLGVDMAVAFGMLREYARNTDQRLVDVARNFVDSASAEFPPVIRRPRRR